MRKALIGLGGVAVAAAVASAVALGAIPGSGGEIQGCYLKIGGVLRVIDPEKGQQCTRFETPLSWNQQGRQGEQGVEGLQGPAGEQGAPGEFAGTLTSPNGNFSISVTNQGIVLSGGGGSVVISDSGVTVEGDDRLTLLGDEEVRLASEGDVSIDAATTVEIQGSAGVHVRSSGDVTIKGSSIGQN